MIDPLTQNEQLQIGLIAFQSSDTCMAVLSKDRTFLATNSAFDRLLGYGERQLVGQPFHSILDPWTKRQDALVSMQEALLLHKKGRTLGAQLTLTPLQWTQSESAPLLLIIKRATELHLGYRSVEDPLAPPPPSLEEIMDGIQDGFFSLDSFGRFTYLNKAVERILERSREELLGSSIWYKFPEAIGSSLYDHYLSSTATQLSDKHEIYYEPLNKWLEIHSYPKENMYTAFIRDITPHKTTEKTLKESEKMYRMIADNSTDMISRIALDGTYLYISPASKTLLGYEPEELMGRSIYQFLHPEDFQASIQGEVLKITEAHINLAAYRVRRKDGTYIWFETTARSILDDKGLNTEIIAISRDISARKHVEKQLIETNELLQKISTIDALTGVANRRGFDESFQKEWKQGIRLCAPLSMILVDIDYFKRYNDSYGHAEGDLCLKRVASALRQAAKRPGDFIARYGGEEFVILLPATDTIGAHKVAEKLRLEVESLKIAHTRSDTSLVTVSLGAATMIPCWDADPQELFIRADKALYQAKQDGRNLARLYRTAE